MKASNTINGKMPEEIKKGLEYCYSIKPCADCQYDKRDFPHCVRRLLGDALAYIQQLESRLAQVERERDAMLTDIPIASMNLCNVCKHDAWPRCAKTGKLNMDTDDTVACEHFEWWRHMP